MKKLFAILLAVAMLVSMTTMASAAENTTTLVTTVPAATYTLNIPATNQRIEFGATKTDIGNITVSNTEHFAEGKNLKVTLTYDPFESDGVTTSIPFTIKPGLAASTGGDPTLTSGKHVTFRGQTDGTLTEKSGYLLNNGGYVDINTLYVMIDSTDWGKALAGEYTATITFTTEVVVE